MPSYNQAHYIADAIHSVLAQDDPDWELWIVDNSTDHTPQVVQQFTDRRIHFHHIAERMDPGACLNWMLERAEGRDFSYIHTDNNLHPAYVRRMRAALADHPLSLAYCDMRGMNQHGQYLHVFRRGKFSLARLLSTDTLGVPFSATAALARQLGGFSERDFADDVKFCVSAHGLARYMHIPDVLVDYRLHNNSRTEAAGGPAGMDPLLIELMLKLLPVIAQRGEAPLAELQRAIRESLDDVDYFVEDLWYRKLAQYSPQWWTGTPRMDHFFFAGLVALPEFDRQAGSPSRQWTLRSCPENITIRPWALARLRHALHRRRHELNLLTSPARNMLAVWACGTLGVTINGRINFRIRSFDFRTLWVARQLQLILDWNPMLDTSAGIAPAWLSWNKAMGTEPLLDCSTEIYLGSESAFRSLT